MLKYYTREFKIRVLTPVVICLNAFLLSSILASVYDRISIAQYYGGLITAIFVVFILKRRSVDAGNKVNRLSGKEIIPVCSYCGKIRHDDDASEVVAWMDAEDYICANSESLLSHGICQKCFKTELEKI